MDPYPEEGTVLTDEQCEAQGWMEWGQFEEIELKPFPNEHAARLKDPGQYKRFRRQNDKFGKGIHAIWGVRKDNNKVELMGIRFDKTKFTVAQAKKWLKDHDYKPIRFEPAGESSLTQDELETGSPGGPLSYKNFALQVHGDSIKEDGTFEGYGSVFGVRDLQDDIVMPGAFGLSLRRHKRAGTKVKMLWQHESHEPIGTWPKIEEDDKGLALQGQLVLEVQRSRECYVLLKAKALDGLSIGFRTQKYENDNETHIRKLVQLDLWEVSPVTFPANPRARVQRVKSVRSVRDLEEALRDAGFSHKEAKAVAAHGYKGLTQRDVDVNALDVLGEALRELHGAMKGS